MSNLYWLSDAQMERLKPFFPKSHGKPRVDDRRVLSGIIFVNRNGLRWCDAPREYGPAKTLYNRWKRWSDNGVFARIMTGLAGKNAEHKTIMIDAVILPVLTGCDRRTHAAILSFMTGERLHRCGCAAGQLAQSRVAARGPGYDADWLREAIEDKGINVCIPGRSSRKKTVKYDKRRYKRRNRIEIMFGRLKDWRRVATRYDRCPETFFSTIALAATVLFWL